MNLKTLTLGALVALSFAACKDHDNTVEEEQLKKVAAEEQAVINDIVNNVIVPTYKDLNSKADAMLGALIQFETGATTETLEKARTAWKEARTYWEQSEGFLYGPVKLPEDLDEAMDTWPVDDAEIDKILAGTSSYTLDTFKTNPETRGFHLIEYFIWDDNPLSLSATQKKFLKLAAQDMARNTYIVHNNWGAGQKYSNYFFTASTGNEKYKSTAAAVSEIASGLANIANEVATEKIANCFNKDGSPAYDKEESRFSKNSTQDFIDNIRSIQNVYTGKYGNKQGKGLSSLIKAKDANLDAQIIGKIQESIDDLSAIRGTFTEALTNDRAGITKAQKSIEKLRDLFDKGVTKYYTIKY